MPDTIFDTPAKKVSGTGRICYLIRHGQTAWNHANRLQGHSDVPLDPVGERQAARLAARFGARHLHGIFTSHLQRSRRTAQVIATGLPAEAPERAASSAAGGSAQAGNGHRLTPVVDDTLAEMHLGEWEGLTPEEIDARFARGYQQWRMRPSSVVIPGAEPLEAFRERVRGAFERIVSGLEDGEYAIVSHGGVIAALLADALAADYDALIRRLRLDNAGVTALEFGTGLPHVLWVNSTSHLQ